jgi:HSP20 family protein
MAVIRWEPIGELNTIQNEMNRLFNTFFDQSQPSGGDGGHRRWIPPMDLVETADRYVLCADLPGVREDDVTVQLDDSVLTIAGHRTAQHDPEHGYHRRERAFGAFSRSLTLPDGTDPDHVEARFDHGVLEVMIPKPEQRKPRQVQIRLTPSDDDAAVIDGTEIAGTPEDRGTELTAA